MLAAHLFHKLYDVMPAKTSKNVWMPFGRDSFGARQLWENIKHKHMNEHIFYCIVFGQQVFQISLLCFISLLLIVPATNYDEKKKYVCRSSSFFSRSPSLCLSSHVKLRFPTKEGVFSQANGNLLTLCNISNIYILFVWQ